MKVKISIELANAAFQTHEPVELVRILRELADVFEAEGNHVPPQRKIFDINGNSVGTVTVGK